MSDVLSLSIDIDSMTLGEMETVEELTGLGLDEIGAAMSMPGPKVKILMALAYVVKRRTEPEITLDAIRAMRVELEDADPKESTASGEPLPSPSPPASLSLAPTGS